MIIFQMNIFYVKTKTEKCDENQSKQANKQITDPTCKEREKGHISEDSVARGDPANQLCVVVSFWTEFGHP